MNESAKILDGIAQRLESLLATQLNNCGLMFRLFSRVKTTSSLAHKMRIKGEKYRSGKSLIQDMIGLRIVAYFQDDVEALATYFSYGEAVGSSIDELDSSTFCPQRLSMRPTLITPMRSRSVRSSLKGGMRLSMICAINARQIGSSVSPIPVC